MEAKQSYSGIGKLDAQELADKLQGAAKAMRDKITTRAEEFAGNKETIKDYLTGYGEILGKVRKSEASTAIAAYSINKDAVKAFDGGYHDWIKACREIRNAGAAPKERTGTKHMKAEAFDKFSKETVKVLNAKQVGSLLEALYAQMRDLSGDKWEHSVLMEIDSLAALLGTSKQPIFQNMAFKIQEIGAEYLDNQAAQEAKEQATKHKAAEEKEINPMPDSPKPIGETYEHDAGEAPLQIAA